MACKYPGVISVVLPMGGFLIGVLIWRDRQSDQKLSDQNSTQPEGSATRRSDLLQQIFKVGGVYSLGVLLTIGPWLLKNLSETGNPVYPLLYSVFGGRDWTPERNAQWKQAHSPDSYAISDLAVKFIDVTSKSDWLSPLLFGLAPLALFVHTRRKLVVGLWCYVGFLFLSWWVLTHRIDRFWVPMIPVVSLLSGIGLSGCFSVLTSPGLRRGFLTALVCVLIFNLGFITSALCGYNAYLIDLQAARENVSSTAPGIQYLNHQPVPQGKVLCIGEAQVFDARFPLVYNTVFDDNLFERWTGEASQTLPAKQWALKPADQIRDKFQDEQIRLLLVNWQEILRYRMTYGYTEYVTRDRFAELQSMGILGQPQVISYFGWTELSLQERERLHLTADHVQEFQNTKVIPAIEVYPVLPASSRSQ